MKNILILAINLAVIAIVNAQTFNYQGALRAHSGEPMVDRQMGPPHYFTGFSWTSYL